MNLLRLKWPELVDYAQRGDAERTAAALELLRRAERRLEKREAKSASAGKGS